MLRVKMKERKKTRDHQKTFEELLCKHRKEKKDLQAEIQKIKHGVPKGDKKRKKEATEQVAKLEKELSEKHNKELAEFNESTSQEKTNNELETKMENLSTNDAETTEVKKSSKAQRRREKKVAQERERQHRIKEQEIKNLDGVRHIETEKLKSILKKLGLTFHQIASDGNCLYNAICHQLSQRNIKATNESLRSEAANYMLAHPDDFMPFLTKPDGDSLYTEEEYKKYCQDVASTTTWGGQMEITALSHVLKLPVKVIQAEGAILQVGEDYNQSPIVLIYHRHEYGLGEHYNSVKEAVADNEEDGF